ncbi:MAG: hypothetical protein ACFFDM_03275 [Candidatus Thorarchaeota archaeon]
MKNKRMKLLAFLFVLVIVCSVIPGAESPVKATHYVTVDQVELSAEVWSDNFDDRDISDWNIYGINGTQPFTVVPGNFTAEDGVLRANGTELAWSIAARDSPVAYGTWRFDVDVVDNYNHEIVIAFFQLVWSLDVWGIDGYFVQIVTGMYGGNAQPRLQAGTVYASSSPIGRTVDWWEPYPYDGDILGWKNIIITREPDGQFYVYINGTLALDHKDNRHTTCEEFHFGTNPGPALDNINVSNTVDYDAAPPEWEPEPTNQVIELGQNFRYDLNASDFSGLGTWGLNDTTNFAIDSNGVITNAVDLELGTYGLNVSISDSQGMGYTSYAAFTVTVQSPPPMDYTLYLLLGGGGIVVVALVVLLMRKR